MENKVTVPNAAAHQGFITNADGSTTFIGFETPLQQQIINLYPTQGLTNIPGGSFANAFSDGTQIGNEHYLLGRMDYTLNDEGYVFSPATCWISRRSIIRSRLPRFPAGTIPNPPATST